MKEIKIEEGKNYAIKKDDVVRITEYEIADEIEIQDGFSKVKPFLGITKLNKYEYMTSDGEIRRYRLTGKKNKGGLRRSLKNLREILKNNFIGARNELFITLTTEKDVSDISLIKNMFRNWWKSMKKIFKGLQFVAVFEKHRDRDSWHIHTIIKDIKRKQLIIPNDFIEELWGNGYTKTSRITDKKKCNEINEDSRMAYKDKITEEHGIDKVISYMTKTEGKEDIPVGERCYLTSKGIKKPKSRKIKYEEAKKEMEGKYKRKREYTSLIINPITEKIMKKWKKETWKKK